MASKAKKFIKISEKKHGKYLKILRVDYFTE